MEVTDRSTAESLRAVCVQLAAQSGFGAHADDDANLVRLAATVPAHQWREEHITRVRQLIGGRFANLVNTSPPPPAVAWVAPPAAVVAPAPVTVWVPAPTQPVLEPARTQWSPAPVVDATVEAPTTPPTPAPAVNAPAPTLTIHPSIPPRAALTIPTDHPLQDQARVLPGATWDGQNRYWTYPITRRAALALRAALTAHAVTVHPDAATALRAAATTVPGYDITFNPATDRIETRYEHTPQLQEAVTRAASWNQSVNAWTTAKHQARALLDAVKDTDLLAHPDVHALTVDHLFDYDLTIDGLRGVPVTELAYVQSQPARKKTPSLADRLGSFGVETIFDLLWLIPARYVDRSNPTKISDLVEGETSAILARILDVGQYDRHRRMCRIKITDGHKELNLTFFQQPWLPKRFRKGDEVTVFGKYEIFRGTGGKVFPGMSNPLIDPTGDTGRAAPVLPIYPQSAKNSVTTWDLFQAVSEAVRRLGDLQDPLPVNILTSHDFLPRLAAFQEVHRPTSLAVAEQARTRLAYDELLAMQLILGMNRAAAAAETGIAHTPTGVLTGAYLKGLPFTSTGAQTRAFAEIRADLTLPHPMHRLLQGDVGSGKTVVAALAIFTALESGRQAALMAPTEILAEQLHRDIAGAALSLTHPTTGTPVVVEFLSGKTRVKEKRRILAGMADGTVHVTVGTHALLSEDVTFHDLGLVVVDEQHRFGVEQRAALRAKGAAGTPDMLIMTATPIPRTAALTAFGDLDITILDELPPGRTPIATTWINHEPELHTLLGPPWDHVRTEVEAGRQAFVVASLVEESETIAAKSAEETFDALQAGALNGLRLGLVHGKLHRDERDATMAAFKAGELDVIVATTVIEVGVNIPAATVMVVLDPGRFGIAQLHQIRGRVGRGNIASTCYLYGKTGSADGSARMNALVASTDGFYLSEVDLDLRGAGSIFGARQSGQTDLRVADLKTDRPSLLLARDDAAHLLTGDPKLNRRPGLRFEIHGALGEKAEQWLAKS